MLEPKRYELDKMLKNYLYGKILNFDRPIKETSENLLGKNVLLFDNNGAPIIYEIQTWQVTTYIPENTDYAKLTSKIQSSLKDYELKKLSEIEPDKSEWHKYTLHQLCDWQYLEDEQGCVVWSDKIILVKYAVILKDSEEKKIGT